jgi:hypothetical protein
MTGRSDDPTPPTGADPVAELEAFIARTEASGEPVPPEARVMLVRLRELMDALRGLTASLDKREKPEPERPDG